jgi:purine-nucleoside phosphorylase
MNEQPYDLAARAATYLNEQAKAPVAAVILGSGLGAFAEQLVDPLIIPYENIPGFPKVGVIGHAGRLVVGKIQRDGPRVAALSGRVHLYEGHDANVIAHPARSLGCWGVKTILFTNAAGAISENLTPGDLMLITDHINMTSMSPLTGHNDDRLGTRFPDMSEAYDRELWDAMRSAATSNQVELREGVYVGLKGPSYETPAEIRMLGRVGADAVGMSTVCEVIAARHMGLRVSGVSCITNYAAGLSDTLLDHAEVKATADLARTAFLKLLNDGLSRMTQICS